MNKEIVLEMIARQAEQMLTLAAKIKTHEARNRELLDERAPLIELLVVSRRVCDSYTLPVYFHEALAGCVNVWSE